ncbi:TIM barrel protein [archaeon]|jgi:deoxyribonuclease IV|nr:TIM barrel protein [archaeon]
MLRIGPAGIGGVKEAESKLLEYHKLGFTAAEVSFTYSTYLKKDDAIRIGKLAKKLNIQLSIHGSYYINLNSEDEEKIEKSKDRILGACEIGHYLGAKDIVFHAGYFGKRDKEESYQIIKENLIELQKEVTKNKWDIKLSPETTGKISVFGSLKETLRLAKETNTAFCIDFAHLKARNQGEIDFNEIIKEINHKDFHIHYSGINYGPKGEKNHIPIDVEEFKVLAKALKKYKISGEIICESPEQIKDSIKMREILE